MTSLQERFGAKEQPTPVGLGGCNECGTMNNPAAEYARKCGLQPIPVNLIVPAATVDPATGEVTAQGIAQFLPTHDGTIFVPKKFRVISATYIDGNGARQDQEDVFLKDIRVSKAAIDCLDSEEKQGIGLGRYSQEECCDGVDVCWPPFENVKNGKDTLSLEFINEQTTNGVDGGGNPIRVGVAVKIRAYILGECTAGYAKHCKPKRDATAA